MTEDQKRPMIIEETVITVPIREAAQRAFENWFKTKGEELAEVLAPWGLDPMTMIVMPQLHRLVREGDGRWVGDLGPGPDPRYLSDEQLALFREALVPPVESPDVWDIDEEVETDGDQR